MVLCKPREDCTQLFYPWLKNCAVFRVIDGDYWNKSEINISMEVWSKQKCIQVTQNFKWIIIYVARLFQYESSLSDSIKFICFIQLASIWICVLAWLNCLQIFCKGKISISFKIVYQAIMVLWTWEFAGNLKSHFKLLFLELSQKIKKKNNWLWTF